jgi:hypothetical protein
MIGSLIDADIIRSRETRTDAQVCFWLHASRSADQLVQLVLTFPILAAEAVLARPLLIAALQNDRATLELALAQEQIHGKAADRAYWAPLLVELEELRWAERRDVQSKDSES